MMNYFKVFMLFTACIFITSSCEKEDSSVKKNAWYEEITADLDEYLVLVVDNDTFLWEEPILLDEYVRGSIKNSFYGDIRMPSLEVGVHQCESMILTNMAAICTFLYMCESCTTIEYEILHNGENSDGILTGEMVGEIHRYKPKPSGDTFIKGAFKTKFNN